MYKGIHTIVTSHCRRGILQIIPFECSFFLHLYQWFTLYLYLPAPHSCCAHTPSPTNSLNLTSHSLCSLPPFVIASYHSCPHPISSTFPLLSHPIPSHPHLVHLAQACSLQQEPHLVPLTLCTNVHSIPLTSHLYPARSFPIT